MSDTVDYFYSVRPCLGERVSGDVAVVEQQGELLFVAIIDALGHGHQAHVVARAAKDCLPEIWDDDVCQTMLRLHERLKDSLGAAVGLAVLNLKTKSLSYTGVGNTVIRILRSSNQKDCPQKLYSTAGIVGKRIRQPTEQKVQLHQSDLVLLYTDGIKEHFSTQEDPAIFVDDVMTITNQLVRRFGKNYDDATCIALKIEAGLA
ncbi:MAG: SpoIIE family protein phosphatase [Cyanobacteria bacterium P01_A01_bin.83]